MSDLEVRQLRYFVAVAEELHFGRAADRLGIAQPPLSRAIRDLERQLGTQLLERTTRQVRLTGAGECLLQDARGVLDAVSAAARRAQNAGRTTPSLRVALKADYDGGLLPAILEAFALEDAAVPVDLLLGSRGDQVPALRDGRADVALLPAPFDDDELDVEPLLTEPRLVAMAATDPLAGRAHLEVADLAGRVLPDGRLVEEEARLDTAVPSRGGAAGRRRNHQTPVGKLDLTQILSLVELGRVVYLPPISLARRHPLPGVVYRPVVDLPPSTLTVTWPRSSRSPAVAAFVRAAVAVGRRHADQPDDAEVSTAVPI